jgi:tetratricopeptide (TPR) repeat protein
MLGRALWIGGEGPRAREALQRSIELLEPEGPSEELARAYMHASTQNMLQGRFDDSIDQARQGLPIAEQLGLDGVRSQLLNNTGVCLTSMGDPSGLEPLRQSVPLAEQSGDAEAIGRAYTNLPSVLGNFGYHRESVALDERGRELARELGAPGFEQFIAANEASSLMELGQYEDAESLAREYLDRAVAMGAAPGAVNAGSTLAIVATRRGRYDDARRMLDDILPKARGLGGTEFLLLTLASEAELEVARGNRAAADQILSEAMDLVHESSTAVHVLLLVVVAAQLGSDHVGPLLDRIRDHVESAPLFRAAFLEADGLVDQDKAKLGEGADVYASLGLPYQEARSALEAGQLDRARDLMRRFGLENGPLGARLQELER